jgi:putative hemolysin
MTSKFLALILILILSVIIVSGCGTTTEELTAELANPASVYCEGQGYTLEMRTDAADGGQYGVCIFPDGSECEEWAFYRGECRPASDTEVVVETPTQAPTPTPAPAEQSTEQPALAQEDWRPLDPAECGDLSDAMTQILSVGVTTVEVSFLDRVNGTEGTGCQLLVTGTGQDFDMTAFEALMGMLASKGWIEDAQYGGGGPTGMLTGFRKESGLCLLLVGWEPSEDADCPEDQPIGMCELTPEQQLYTITLDCAESVE